MILTEQIPEFSPSWILLSTFFFRFLGCRRPSVVKKNFILRKEGGKQLTLERMLE